MELELVAMLRRVVCVCEPEFQRQLVLDVP